MESHLGLVVSCFIKMPTKKSDQMFATEFNYSLCPEKLFSSGRWLCLTWAWDGKVEKSVLIKLIPLL